MIVIAFILLIVSATTGTLVNIPRVICSTAAAPATKVPEATRKSTIGTATVL